MGKLEDAFRDAAGEVAQIKAQPSNRYWWLYGTIKVKNGNGTLDVAIDGVTIQQVKATVSCMTANVGDRAIVLKAGPLMTCVDVIATSDKVVTPADSIEGTISADNLPVATHESLGALIPGKDFSLGADGGIELQRPVLDSEGAGNGIFGAAGIVFSNVGGGHSGSKIATDLDNVTPGVWMYNKETAHIPNDWGVCLTIWSNLDREGQGDWRFQLAFPTGGDPKWRRNINRGGWSSWWTIPSN